MKYNYLIILICCLITTNTYTQTNHSYLYPIKENGKVGLIDTSGNIVVKPKFFDAGACSDGLCLYRVYGKDYYMLSINGYINYQGDTVIPAQYELAMPFQEGKALIYMDRKPYFINKKGNIEIEIDAAFCHSFNEGLAIFSKTYSFDSTNTVGAINHKGEIVFTLSGFSLSSFDNGYATLIQKISDGKFEYFLVDKKGNIVKQLPNSCVDVVEDGLFPFVENNKYGFMNIEEKVIIPPTYSFDNPSDIKSFQENLCCVKKDGKWGFINKNGDVVIPFQYDMVQSFKGTLTQVTKGNNVFYINKKGQVIYPKQP